MNTIEKLRLLLINVRSIMQIDNKCEVVFVAVCEL